VDHHPYYCYLCCDGRRCPVCLVRHEHFFGECKTVVRNSIPSPDGSKSIVIFGKECGATVGFNTQASIAPADGSFSPDKNPAFFVVSGEHVVLARWLGDSAVEIALQEGGKVFRNEQRVGDIKVVYPGAD
jgi:hypothetical protein